MRTSNRSFVNRYIGFKNIWKLLLEETTPEELKKD